MLLLLKNFLLSYGLSIYLLEKPEARKILDDWNLELDKDPLQMEGRIHAGPTLNFGKREVAVQADFSKDALSGVVNAVREVTSLALFLN